MVVEGCKRGSAGTICEIQPIICGAFIVILWYERRSDTISNQKAEEKITHRQPLAVVSHVDAVLDSFWAWLTDMENGPHPTLAAVDIDDVLKCV